MQKMLLTAGKSVADVQRQVRHHHSRNPWYSSI